MEDASARAGAKRRNPWTMFVVVSLYLTVIFVWRFFMPAGEYPSAVVQYLSMALDAGMLVGLVGSKMQVTRSLAPDDGDRVFATVLFCIALLAGLGLFAIRLSGEVGWETGHRIFHELR
jgi:hypothetical protein